MILNNLPTEIIIKILSYLDYTDLVRCSSVSHRLHDASNSNELWKVQCEKIWIITHKVNEPWRSVFVSFYNDFGRYVKCYARIKEAWNNILHFVSINCKEIHGSVKDGATEEEICEAEERLGFSFPEDYRCSLRLHNGQNHIAKGLMGSMGIHNHYRSESILDVAFASRYEFLFNGCIPVTLCLDSGIAQHLVLDRSSGLEPGTVFYPADVQQIRRQTQTRFNAFISGKSYSDWLVTYANQLHGEEFVIKESQIFRFRDSCDCALKSDVITVTARTCFMPEFSSIQKHNFFHTYEITMVMDSDASSSKSCQLETRHWSVISDNGYEEQVSGPGVVGEFPIMKPGTSYSWVSCSIFRTTYGSMKGYFTMRNLTTGHTVDVICPTFHMKSLPYMTDCRTQP